MLVNGTAMGGIIEAEVQSTSFFSADRFSLRAAVSASGLDAWSGVPLLVEIQISVDGDQVSLISGNADRVAIDPIRREINLAGRDFASLFVGTQIDLSFENQTSSEIATYLAEQQGLQALVTQTDTLIGRYYQNGRTRTALTQHARATTSWDLLCWLAQLEGFDVWVAGQTLYFQPVVPTQPSLTIAPSDCISMGLNRALDIAGGVTINVKSWDCVSQTAVLQSASSAIVAGAGLIRTVVRPNLSSADAQALASQLLDQTTQHERQVIFEIPGDLVTVPRMIILLTSTGTDFDGLYTVCSVERRLSFAGGFVQSVEARSIPWTVS